MTVEERRAKAREMYARRPRPTIRQIAESLGVSVGTVHRDVNPEAAERYRVAAREHNRRLRGRSRRKGGEQDDGERSHQGAAHGRARKGE